MNQERMDDIADKIEDLTVEIVMTARLNKEISEPAFISLKYLLEELSSGVVNNVALSKKLVGKLFFIYSQILTETFYCTKGSQLLDQFNVITMYLREIFNEKDL